MPDYKHLITTEAMEVNRLHQNVKDTFKNSNKNQANWSNACKAFHAYSSRLDIIINKIYTENDLQNQELIEFSIIYLELDPMYFRSGYFKEEILRKIKRTMLTEQQKSRLRNVLYNAVEKRGTREYKAYCRLASIITDETLNDWLCHVIENRTGAQRSRAKLMLYQINHNKHPE